ncbi:MAG: substrate-binding domain-containing protein, partial [Stellaceae bacterium]
MMTAELMTTDEVAEYLRLKPRRIYELVRTGEIPCARITGKLLFPRQAIELWVSQRTAYAGLEARRAPPVVAGSHDPLLEWALRESGCGLALLSGGSLDGLRRLADCRAVLAGIHIVDPGGDDNIAALKQYAELADVVLIEWARREQGLILARGNPLGIRALDDLAAGGARVARRQEAAGAHLLLLHLLEHAGIAADRLGFVDPPTLTETDLA